MTKQVLVLGGTRFFGKRLVEKLLEDGQSVTIATRGTTSDSFGDRVERLKVDRTDEAALAAAVEGKHWDVVYDNICYNADEARAAVRVFTGKVGRYVLTSSLSVYDAGSAEMTEEQVDTASQDAPPSPVGKVGYAEGKRQAESVFFREAPFPAASARFPIVLGPNDYTKRLHFHVERIKNGVSFVLPNPEARICFIYEAEAADFLKWLGEAEVAGAFNAASDGRPKLRELLAQIDRETGRSAIVLSEGPDSESSPFGIEDDWTMDTSRARKAGYAFRSLDDWMPELIGQLARGEA
ncbi:NAD-dependent epimerase/dehydratase family protein [Saccharibacillus sp. CPCC 101409]|uniref:NAD-dependent epimerase/dehydratase family protein n=1 Tax=Saccharibacillus sp. CPCC 101409 TaxID=3058041 RepID=UPI00267271C4|nr:NAD-dependent epimerase/dehydratase family protein [Saccharibacillus sp. CPCC 101409]MDO3410788.1 NAD-dependent epimerase/dehydratase family protein [Saccharibacillus sp. CPCC 101409]